MTHPERVIDASTGITKLDLVRYYALVAPLMLAHLKGRPVSLVRAPAGIGGELFFQKHMERSQMPGVALLDPALDPDHAPLLEVATRRGLLSAAQMNVVEFHTWNAVKSAIGKPDRMTFDLDPGEGVDWPAMQQAAELVRVFLDELGLRPSSRPAAARGCTWWCRSSAATTGTRSRIFRRPSCSTWRARCRRSLRRQERAAQPRRQDLHRLPAQRLRRHHGVRLVGARAPGLGVSVPVRLGRAAAAHRRRALDLRNIQTRLDQGNAPWAAYAQLGAEPHGRDEDAGLRTGLRALANSTDTVRPGCLSRLRRSSSKESSS